MKKCFGYIVSLAMVAMFFASCDGSGSNSPATAQNVKDLSSHTEDKWDANDSLDAVEGFEDEDDEEDSDERIADTEPFDPEEPEQDESSSSSSNTPASSETAPNSSAFTLQEYESAQPFIDDGWRDECLRLANEYRATEGVAPLVLADDSVQLCTIRQAAADLAENTPHGHTKMCGIGAQNSGPNFSTTWKTSATEAVKYYIKMMWEDEKALVTSGERDPDKDEDYKYIGHYLNMRNSAYTKLACGIAISEDGKKGWFNMNFYW